MLIDVIFWIVFGGLVGLIASKIMSADSEVNGLMNIVVGVVGAIIGGLVFNLLGGSGVTGFNIYSFIVAIIGAVILLFIVKMFKRA